MELSEEFMEGFLKEADDIAKELKENPPPKKVYTKFILRQPEIVEAKQWFQVGDAPDDSCTCDRSLSKCERCGHTRHRHGRIRMKNGTLRAICPGDYIVRHSDNRIDCLRPEEFEAKYEPWIPCNECLYCSEE